VRQLLEWKGTWLSIFGAEVFGTPFLIRLGDGVVAAYSNHWRVTVIGTLMLLYGVLALGADNATTPTGPVALLGGLLVLAIALTRRRPGRAGLRPVLSGVIS
jgi:glycerol uptake facilitator-like aquaporin